MHYKEKGLCIDKFNFCRNHLLCKQNFIFTNMDIRLNEIKISFTSFTVFLSDFNETGRIIKQNILISADDESLCLLLYYYSDSVSVKSFQIGVSNVNRYTKMNRKPEFKFIVRRESKVGHHFGVYHRYLWYHWYFHFRNGINVMVSTDL